MTRIGVLSDLHIERTPFPHALPAADVYVFAGDTGVKQRGLAWVLDATAGIPSVYLLGNHEYYGGRFPTEVRKLKEMAAGTHVHVLERDAVTLAGVRFLGASLWTDFALLADAGLDAVPPTPVSDAVRIAHIGAAMTLAEDKVKGMTDYAKITYEQAGRFQKLNPRHTAVTHGQTVRWLREQLAAPCVVPTVVVTHHAPTVLGCRPGAQRIDHYAPCYASHLDELVATSAAAVWIHGHTHYTHDTMIGGTRVVSNPRGYEDLIAEHPEQATNYDPGFCIELAERP
jgi:predicted phosphodiesterase